MNEPEELTNNLPGQPNWYEIVSFILALILIAPPLTGEFINYDLVFGDFYFLYQAFYVPILLGALLMTILAFKHRSISNTPVPGKRKFPWLALVALIPIAFVVFMLAYVELSH